MAQNPAGRAPAPQDPPGRPARTGPSELNGARDGWTPVVRQNRRRVVAIVVALAMLLTVVGGTAVSILGAMSASAHDQLVSSDPADGAELDEPVDSLTLTFSSEVIPDGTQVRVTTPQGESDAEVAIDGEAVTATFDAAGAGGAYDAVWRVVSSDGHPIEGQLGWTVADQPDAAPEESPTDEASEPSDAGSAEAELEESGELDGLGAAAPSPSASAPAAEDADEGAGSMPLVYGAALVAMIGVAVALLARSRRRLHDSHDASPPGRPAD